MNDARRKSERGEGNVKLIITLLVLGSIGYGLYVFMPIYYKEQQLIHDIKEEARIGAINNRAIKEVEEKCKEVVDTIDIPTNAVKFAISRKGDVLTINCTGSLPAQFPFYTYDYKIDFSQSFSRGGY